jgi:hypothetical protein
VSFKRSKIYSVHPKEAETSLVVDATEISLSLTGEFEVVIMIDCVTEELHGSPLSSRPETITSEPWLVWQTFNENEMALFGMQD